MKHVVHIVPKDIEIEVEHGTSLKDAAGDFGIDFPCGGKGVCGNCQVELLSGKIEMTGKHREILERKGLPTDHWRLACYSTVTDDITVMIPEREQVILSDNDNVGLKGEDGLCIAVDLGSTTIVAQLIDRNDGRTLCTQAEINVQNKYGADIISRIAYSIKDKANRQEISVQTRKQIGRMISNLLAETGNSSIRKVVLVGNSVMHHIFCNLDLAPLSAYPFQSPSNQAVKFRPAELGWNLDNDCEIIFMPNISHFVGSDILAGIIQLGMAESGNWNAMIDLGTNGEIVIGDKDRMVCSSTAAGPAFEGVNITNGMRAITGAICHVDEATGTAEVIGKTKATGICGSGLIDAIHHFLKKGLIENGGNLADDSISCLPIADGISLDGRDVREFQLAKAAISTGFELLLKELGIGMEQLEHIYVSGGLGTYLDIRKARELGLIKSCTDSQTIKAGNTALAGCRKMTYDCSAGNIDKVLGIIRHVSLETSPDFQDRYCENLFF